MAGFNPFAGKTPEPINPFQTVEKAKVESERSRDRKRSLLPPLVSVERLEAEERIEAGVDQPLIEEARNNALRTQDIITEGMLEDFSQDKSEDINPQEVLVGLAEQLQKTEYFSDLVDPVVVAQVLSGDNDLSKRRVFDKLAKVSILADLMYDSLESATDPWYRDFDFIESFTQNIPVYSSIVANRKIQAAEQIRMMLVSSDMSNEEFSIRVEEILEEISDLGLFSDENKWALLDLFDMIPGGSKAGAAGSNLEFWATVDNALAGFGVVNRGVKFIRAGSRTQALGEIASDVATLQALTGGNLKDIEKTLLSTALRDSPNTASTNLGNKLPSGLTPDRERSFYLVAEEKQALRAIEEENALLNYVLSKTGYEIVDEDLFEIYRKEFLEDVAKKGNFDRDKQIIDWDLQLDQQGNLFYTEVLGNSKGGYYTSEARAMPKVTSIGPLAKAVKVGEGKWQIEISRPVALQPSGGNTIEDLRLWSTTNPDELGYGAYAKHLGTPSAQTTTELNAVLKEAESTRAALLDTADKNLRAMMKPLKKHELVKVGKLLDELNYGKFAHERKAFSPDNFRDEYYRLFNERPRQQVVDAYLSIQARSDVAYFLKADVEFKNAVNRGVNVLLVGKGEKVERIKFINQDKGVVPDGALVYDIDSGKAIAKGKITDSHKVMEMDEALYTGADGKKYDFVVSTNPRVDRVYHSDVLGYNPGGVRAYYDNQVKIVIKQDNSIKLADGRVRSESPNVLMTTRTTDEAKIAVEGFNTIVDEIVKRLPAKSKEDLNEFVKGLDTDVSFIRMLRDNTEWNRSLRTASELALFAKQTGVNLSKKVDWSPSGSTVGDTAGGPFLPGVSKKRTLADTFLVQSTQTGARRNVKLHGFGGDELPTVPAIQSMNKDFVQQVSHKTQAAYITKATAGLMKSLIENSKVALGKQLDSDLAGLTLKQKLIRLEDYINKGTVEGKKLDLERHKILARMDMKPPYLATLTRWKNDLADAFYKRGWKKTSDWLDSRQTDPVAAMKSYTFDAWLGMGAWDQYWVQGNQVFNIMPIAGVAGIKGVAAYGPVRFLVLNGNQKVLESFANRIAPTLGLRPDQFVEMVTMLKQNGRLVTGLSITELGEESAYTGILRGVREKGRFFFNEGELSARISAHNAAYMEFVKKFPDQSAMSQAGRRFIANRADVLTNSMTSASRNAYQHFPFTQFLTYTWNVSEQLALGSFGGSKKILTGAEKARLLGGHVLLYGLTGLPFAGMYLDKLYNKKQVDIDKETYSLMRYGMLDFLLSNAIGADTATSTRLAWGNGFSEFAYDVMDKPLLEALVGPSGQFASDGLGVVFKLIRDIKLGSPELIEQDLSLLIRSIKSGNLMHDTYTAMLYGDYISRNGKDLVDDDVSVHETIALALGMPLQEYVERRSMMVTMSSDTRYQKRVSDDIERMMVSIRYHYENEDFEAVDNLRKQIAIRVQSLPPMLREKVWRAVSPKIHSEIDLMSIRAVQQGYRNPFLNKDDD